MTTYPSRPVDVWGTSVLLAIVGVAAGLSGGATQPAFAVYCLAVSVGPLRGTAPARERATLLAYGVLSWAVFGLAPGIMVGEPLGGPYGGHPAVFVGGLLAATARIAALSSRATASWCAPRIES